ncbi:MAG: MotA/TolQ/ExbB proton channel family protein [Flavobacteriaceae bacterium]|nr:MotA/TolQ/ExbB proton channel family protein [Flavobacteriaceae bacterium]
MFNLFYEGGILFMSILTLLLLVVLSISVYYGTLIYKTESEPELRNLYRHRITYIKSIGLLSLVVGIFGQLIGMYQGFSMIQLSGEISQSLLITGIRISMITTLYGMVIFIISYLIWLVLDSKFNKL